ncbi:hypothetical protein BJX70DRAFT_400711 [Aspergillus crustosus]
MVLETPTADRVRTLAAMEDKSSGTPLLPPKVTGVANRGEVTADSMRTCLLRAITKTLTNKTTAGQAKTKATFLKITLTTALLSIRTGPHNPNKGGTNPTLITSHTILTSTATTSTNPTSTDPGITGTTRTTNDPTRAFMAGITLVQSFEGDTTMTGMPWIYTKSQWARIQAYKRRQALENQLEEIIQEQPTNTGKPFWDRDTQMADGPTDFQTGHPFNHQQNQIQQQFTPSPMWPIITPQIPSPPVNPVAGSSDWCPKYSHSDVPAWEMDYDPMDDI